jgi:CubicO group peptidase (beta-lactamase class C family)
MFRFLKQGKKNINSLLIIRNGYLVLESYFSPHSRTTIHDVASVTKSITSLLTGAAIRQGYLDSVQQRVVDLLPEPAAQELSPEKQAITVEHLLSMTSGLRWNESAVAYTNPENDLTRMSSRKDWSAFWASRPMSNEPGQKFNYNSGGYHLLSALLQHQTGRTLAEFASEQLFAPLGINEYDWPSDPSGVTQGNSRLCLPALALARVGYLLLQKGQWGGVPIVPADFAEASTRHFVAISSASSLGEFKLKLFRIIGRRKQTVPYTGYGYGWYLPTFGGFAARGYGGQAIFVLPAAQLIVVFTACLRQADTFLPEFLMGKYILPALQPMATHGLASTPALSLQQIVEELAAPEPIHGPARDTVAGEISGRYFAMDANAAGVQGFRLSFGSEHEAVMELLMADQELKLLLGLDAVFRLNKSTGGDIVGGRGVWVARNKFVVETRSTRNGDIFNMLFTFQDQQVVLLSQEWLSGKRERFTGNLGEADPFD